MDSAETILLLAKMSKRVALDTDTKFLDARSNGPVPADFGEHEEIPEEAIELHPLNVVSKAVEGE